jgi:DNA-binding SARP family transcriptional activator
LIITDRVGSSFAYTLRIARENIDEGRFERFITDGHRAFADGRFQDAANLAREALALWHGEPLADVAHRSFAVPTISRLDALYRAAWRLRAEALVQLGRYPEAIVELDGLVGRWPGDEDLRQLLIACLWHSGRTEEAARVCQTGIELMFARRRDVTGLRALQREVLRSPARLDAVARLRP